MLRDSSPSEELGRLVREVVAVVVQQIIPVRRCSKTKENSLFRCCSARYELGLIVDGLSEN